jgi:hypothetical protein
VCFSFEPIAAQNAADCGHPPRETKFSMDITGAQRNFFVPSDLRWLNVSANYVLADLIGWLHGFPFPAARFSFRWYTPRPSEGQGQGTIGRRRVAPASVAMSATS